MDKTKDTYNKRQAELHVIKTKTTLKEKQRQILVTVYETFL